MMIEHSTEIKYKYCKVCGILFNPDEAGIFPKDKYSLNLEPKLCTDCTLLCLLKWCKKTDEEIKNEF